MKEYQVSQVKNLKNAISLINYTFREKDDCLPTMHQEFPLLLSLQNQQNIRTLEENGKLASVASFLPREILIQGYPIQVGSVGAVCTAEGYQKKGYSSIVLDDLERKMQEDNIDVMLVSGRRNLYQRRGCSLVSSFYEYTFLPQKQESSLLLREYKAEDIYRVVEYYNCKSTRFNRTLEDFDALMQARAIPWGKVSSVFYLIEEMTVEEMTENSLKENRKENRDEGKDEIGYLFLNVIEGESGRIGNVVEAACEPEVLAKAIKQAAFMLNLQEITYHVHQRDKLNYMNEYQKKEVVFQEGTVKIISFCGLMEKLKSYFAQYLKQDEMDRLKFYEENGTYSIIFEDEQYITQDIGEINKLVFEGTLPFIAEREKALGVVLKKIFPIPMPWVGNLNYQ